MIDGTPKCADHWYPRMILTTMTSLILPVTMGIINVLVELIINALSTLTRPTNEAKNIKDAITGISWIQYINLGTILITVGLNINLEYYLGFPNPKGVF